MSKKSDLQWACLGMEKYKQKYHKFNDGFLRPVYQYTSQEHATVAELHKDDYLKDNWRP